MIKLYPDFTPINITRILWWEKLLLNFRRKMKAADTASDRNTTVIYKTLFGKMFILETMYTMNPALEGARWDGSFLDETPAPIKESLGVESFKRETH